MTLSDSDIVTLRRSYIRDLWIPAVPNVSPAVGLSNYNREVKADFFSDSDLQAKADETIRRFAFELPSIYVAELDWQKAIGTSVTPYLTTAQGSNKDLTFTAKTITDDVTIAYLVSGASTSLSVSVTGKAITIHVATTSGSVADSTANQISAAVVASAPANALVSVALPSGSDGTGKPATMAVTHLTSDAQRAALALQTDALFRGIRAEVFEAMVTDDGFIAYIPTDSRSARLAEMRTQIAVDRQFITDKTVQGRRRIAAGWTPKTPRQFIIANANQ
jgi:hypothetical protein